ncbi:MAG: NYN domain-containing protein [Hyphomicrobiales bacterium]|nr:NYN domain-containing protein [Hyphomicrobiales bacterium]
MLRFLYYDAPPFEGMVRLPVSKKRKQVRESGSFLDDLAVLNYVAVRRGQLRFKAWAPKKKQPIRDEDYRPVYEQKGVDTRIALDIANFCARKTVDRIILFSGDTDLIPALKYARIAGLQTALLQLPPPARKLDRKLVAHSDLVLNIEWPSESSTADSP